jgi:hypothetical protein
LKLHKFSLKPLDAKILALSIVGKSRQLIKYVEYLKYSCIHHQTSSPVLETVTLAHYVFAWTRAAGRILTPQFWHFQSTKKKRKKEEETMTITK